MVMKKKAQASADPIEAARELLQKSGYTVKYNRTEPKVGDVFRFHESGQNVLIMFQDKSDDQWDWGGVAVDGTNNWDDITWIDKEVYDENGPEYELIGHIDLSLAMNTK